MDLNENESLVVSESLDANIKKIKADFGEANDLLIREVTLQDVEKTKAAVIGIDGLINSTDAQDFIVKLMTAELSDPLPSNGNRIFDFLLNSWISMIDANQGESVQEMYDNILNGHIVILVDGAARFMMFDCKGWQSRGISEPNTEKSLRGPKDSFVETIRFNTAMLRRRLRDPRLRFDAHSVGTRSKTDVFVAYIEGITNPEFIKIANERIKAINVDVILNTYELISLIQDKHHTFFPRLSETERPDRVMKALTQGQVAIFVDGSPFVILAPFHFTEAFSAIDDYYNPPTFSTIKRIMRYTGYFVVILLPSVYIALSAFHQQMIPTSLLISIINQRAANPFSTFVEMLIIAALFEILREASLRKPDAIGDSMTIVGSLIIGQTIVQAGLVSYASIIVGSITTIASFLLSSTTINVSARIIRIIFMFIAASFGFYGIILAFIVLITHLASITSFNQAYLAPMAPFNLSDQKDQIFKAPIEWMKKRPKIFDPLDLIRSNLGESKD